MPDKKIYKYNSGKIKRKIVSTFRKRKREATIADLITETGIPKYQIDETLKNVMNQYYGHMKVTETGQILYYFPQGMRNRTQGIFPALKRGIKKGLSLTGTVFSFLFKIWIMVMLVGYAVLFAALVIFSIAVSLAGNNASGGRRRSRSFGGFGSFYLTIKLFEIIRYSSTRKQRNMFQTGHQKSRPLHRSIFAFVFGDENPNKEWELIEKQNVINFIQRNKGIITIEELMSLTGKDHSAANKLVNRFLLEFEGEPEVTNNGSLYYKFPELMYLSENNKKLPDRNNISKKVIAFNSNRKKTNNYIAFFNGFNILFGSYFIYFSTFAGIEIFRSRISLLYQITRTYLPFKGINPDFFLFVSLGLIPIIFSIMFFLIPAIRSFFNKKANKKIGSENFLQKIYKWILKYPEAVEAEDISPSDDYKVPDSWEKIRKRGIEDFGIEKEMNIKEAADGTLIYSFPELKREKQDINALRGKIDLSEYHPSGIIYDSGK